MLRDEAVPVLCEWVVSSLSLSEPIQRSKGISKRQELALSRRESVVSLREKRQREVRRLRTC